MGAVRISSCFQKMAARLVNLSHHVKELRLHLCQKSPSSQGVRNFVEKYYVDIKKNNPDLPILIRECSGVQPKIIARFDYGVERNVSVIDKNADEVLTSLEGLVKSQ